MEPNPPLQLLSHSPHSATKLSPTYNANARAANPTAAAAGPKLAAMPVLDATGLPLPEPVAVEPALMVAVPLPIAIDAVPVDIAVAGSAAMAPYAEQSALGAVGQLDY
jgi:hypothetical protein